MVATKELNNSQRVAANESIRELQEQSAFIAALTSLQEQQRVLSAQQQQIIERLEKSDLGLRKKDKWDCIAAIAPILSGAIIALGGAWFTTIYNQQQLKLQEIQTIEKFFPHLTGDEKSKRAAILAISSLTNAKLASKVAAVFASEGTVSALEQIAKHADTGDRTIANGALARALDSMAANYETEKRYEEAIKTSERAMALREESYGSDSPRVLPSLNQLVELYKAHRNYSEAESLLQRAVAIQKGVYGAESPQVAAEMKRLVDLYQARGAVDKAKLLAARVAAIEEKNRGSSRNSEQVQDSLLEEDSTDPSLPSFAPSSRADVGRQLKSDETLDSQLSEKRNVASDVKEGSGEAVSTDANKVMERSAHGRESQ